MSEDRRIRPMLLLACEPDGAVTAAWEVPNAAGARDLLGTVAEAEGIVTVGLCRADASPEYRADPGRWQVTGPGGPERWALDQHPGR
jgi:hypothetical protein